MNLLANVQEGGTGIWLSFPTLRHHVVENIRAVLWSVHLAALLHIGHDLLIGKTLVG